MISSSTQTKAYYKKYDLEWDNVMSDYHFPKNCYIYFNESPWKMMKSAFYFMVKALRSQEISIFVLTFWSYRKTAWSKVNLKIYDITSWLTTTIHILLNISRSQGNQAIKFGQLIEYNKINIFLENSCRKWGKQASSRPLSFS